MCVNKKKQLPIRREPCLFICVHPLVDPLWAEGGGRGIKEGHQLHQAGNIRPSSSRFVIRSSRRDGQEGNGKVPEFKLPPGEGVWA